MRGFLRTLSAIIFGLFLLVLAYHFTAPTKGLVSGEVLRLRIAAAGILVVLKEDIYKGYQMVLSAPKDDRFKTGVAESTKLRDDIVAAYNKGTLTTYLAGLRTTMTELLNAIRHDMNAPNSTENIKEETIETVSPEQFVRSARTWLALNEKRMAAVQGVDGDQTQEQIKSDLVRLQAEIASAAGDYEKKLSETGGRNAKPRVRIEEAKDQPAREKAEVESNETVKKVEKKDILAAPAKIVAAFVDRYSNREVRHTSYYFKDIKAIRNAQAALPSVYCITFQANVYHKHNNKRWDKSPVVLNAIAVMTRDGVMSTYESFAGKPGEYPRDGACVKPIWGVHDYKWEEICPYGCMSSRDVSANNR